MSASASRRDQGGFVLAFVVFMLFAISVAGAAGYLVVSSEFSLAKYSGQGAEALVVARAGLERFVAEQIGVVGDSVSYALGDGVALVTTRKLFAQDSVTDVYFIRSQGTVEDVFAPASPAERVVGAYAIHHRRPIPHFGASIISAATISVANGGQVHGVDSSAVSDCAGGGATTIAGAISRVTVTESLPTDLEGSPEFRTWPGGGAEILDSIGIRWDVLSDPDFPVEFENTLPAFGSLPADSFPIVRYTGWVTPSFAGRGVLIIDGTFDPAPGFSWDGIVLAGHVDDIIQGQLRGMLIGGLEGINSYPTIDHRTRVHYYSCHVYRANETLSYLELLENTVFEAS